MIHPTFTLMTPFSARKQACGPEVPPLAGLRAKSIDPVISGCRFSISDFLGSLFQSAIGIPQFGGGLLGCPAGRPYIGIGKVLGQERSAPGPQEKRIQKDVEAIRESPLQTGLRPAGLFITQ
ncbi:MAG: hypothetical protein H6Q44_1933 [Deltaproteobacteria bacterium]|jgi:hypothetical protein|nr:hypothetical protein [Deltaproteobacteria bacterium]